MDVIILAAGYATRLYPLTLDKPKPLLEVAGKPIIEHIIQKLETLDSIKNVYVITNDKFLNHFNKWLENFTSGKNIEIISDGTKSNDDRLGAVGDINFVIKSKNIDGNLLVVAGDNLFEQSLEEINVGDENAIVLFDVKDKELAKKYGVVAVEDGIVVDFEEKPENPKSTLISTGVYLFNKKTIRLIGQYIDEENNSDKTGDFVQWLYQKERIKAFITDKKWYDIGSKDQLEEANRKFQK